MFLVLLEVCVHKEAPGGVDKRVLHVVHALVPARAQRGGSRGYLVGGDTFLCVIICVHGRSFQAKLFEIENRRILNNVISLREQLRVDFHLMGP